MNKEDTYWVTIEFYKDIYISTGVLLEDYNDVTDHLEELKSQLIAENLYYDERYMVEKQDE